MDCLELDPGQPIATFAATIRGFEWVLIEGSPAPTETLARCQDAVAYLRRALPYADPCEEAYFEAALALWESAVIERLRGARAARSEPGGPA